MAAVHAGYNPSSDLATSATFIRHFEAYMASRATVTAELPDWSDAVYDIAPQRDGSSCSMLALVAAEAIFNDVPLTAVDVSAVAFYRRYIKARLLLHSRPYDSVSDAVCDLPFCSRPRGRGIQWTQYDRCDRWCHDVCTGRPASYRANETDAVICTMC